MMKFQILQENFAKALSISSRFVSNRAQLPVLSNIFLCAKKNKLTVASTNLEVSVSIDVGAKVEKEGDITVPAKAINDLVSNLSSGTVSVQGEKEKLYIKAPNFTSGLLGMNASDFPSIPHSVGKNAIKLSRDDFIESLSYVLFSVSFDETRPVLTGVLLIFDGKDLHLVSTDGFRLSRRRMTMDLKGIKEKEFRIILPKTSLSELSRLFSDYDNIDFSYQKGESQVVFEAQGSVLSSRTIEGDFPDFEKIIPKDKNYHLSLDREDMLRAVRLASVFARDSANVVRLKIKKNSVDFIAESSQAGSQENSVDAKVEFDSKDERLEIAFNCKFLEDFLNSIKGNDINISLTDANSPGLFTDLKDKDYIHLVMPVKLKD